MAPPPTPTGASDPAGIASGPGKKPRSSRVEAPGSVPTVCCRSRRPIQRSTRPDTSGTEPSRREGLTRLVAGRSSGFRLARSSRPLLRERLNLPPRLPIPIPHRNSGLVAAVVAGHSGASAADSHGLPFWSRAPRDTCNVPQSTRPPPACQDPRRENGRKTVRTGGLSPNLPPPPGAGPPCTPSRPAP